MSTYEDYESTSKVYDSGRVAAGANIIAALVSTYVEKPLSQVHLLDAGCGTGNYSKAMLLYGVGKVTLLDASEGMLAKARKKVEEYANTGNVAQIIKHCLPSMPFPDNHFDVVIFMQVLHHLDKPWSDYSNTKEALASTYRVLKPGGVLVVNYSSREQCQYGNWYASFVPKASKEAGARMIGIKEFHCHLRKLGFADLSELIHYDATPYAEDQYMANNNIKDEKWRSLDSMWKIAADIGEVDEAVKKYNDLQERGTLEKELKELHNRGLLYGQARTLVAKKIRV